MIMFWNKHKEFAKFSVCIYALIYFMLLGVALIGGYPLSVAVIGVLRVVGLSAVVSTFAYLLGSLN